MFTPWEANYQALLGRPPTSGKAERRERLRAPTLPCGWRSSSPVGASLQVIINWERRGHVHDTRQQGARTTLNAPVLKSGGCHPTSQHHGEKLFCEQCKNNINCGWEGVTEVWQRKTRIWQRLTEIWQTRNGVVAENRVTKNRKTAASA